MPFYSIIIDYFGEIVKFFFGSSSLNRKTRKLNKALKAPKKALFDIKRNVMIDYLNDRAKIQTIGQEISQNF